MRLYRRCAGFVLAKVLGCALLMGAGATGAAHHMNQEGDVADEHAPAGEAVYPVRVGDMWGYIDVHGRVAIEPRFVTATEFDDDGYAFVTYGERGAGPWGRTSGVIDRKGNILLEQVHSVLGRGRFVLRGEPLRFIGLIEPFDTDIRPDHLWGPFREGLVPVQIGDAWGLMDELGQLAVEPRFEALHPHGFSEGLIGAMLDGKWGFVDHGGRWVVQPQFDGVRPFREGHAVVTTHRGQGWFEQYMRRNGEIAIPRQFISAHPFSEGRAAVRQEGDPHWGFIDVDGNWVLPPQFTMAGTFAEGLAPAKAQDGRQGYIDHHGNFVILLPPGEWHGRLYSFRNGTAEVRMDDWQGYITRTGRWLWPDQLSADSGEDPVAP